MMKFFLFLLANLFLVFLYFGGHMTGLLGRKDTQVTRKDVIMKSIVMLLCPVVAVSVFLFGYFLKKTVYRKPVDLNDVIFSKERVKTYSYADEEQERNLVPLQDAIAITDTDNLRALMMTVVSGDIRQSLATIAVALNSADSETSHYAAAVLQESLDTFRSKLQNAMQEIMENPKEKLELAIELFDSMDPVLRQKVFTGLEQISMVHHMDELGDIIFETSPSALTSEQMEAVCIRLLEAAEYERCRKWCERQDYQYPDNLATYTCALKLYFNTGRKKKFFRVLNDLKKSDIVVDSETLELIRVFM